MTPGFIVAVDCTGSRRLYWQSLPEEREGDGLTERQDCATVYASASRAMAVTAEAYRRAWHVLGSDTVAVRVLPIRSPPF